MASNQSRKERDILEQQRKLAALIRPGSSNDTKISKPIKKPAPKPKVLSKRKPDGKSKRTGIDLSTSLAMKKPPPPSHKRPGSSSGSNKPSRKRTLGIQTPQSLVEEARANAARSCKEDGTKKKQKNEPLKSPILQRKPKEAGSATGSSSLAKLVQHASVTSCADAASAIIQTVTPDDFWKNLREWDLVSQFASDCRQQAEQRNPKEEGEESSSPVARSKPLPNVFLNPRHYMAAWAPLCLAECRAQLLQEFIMNQSKPIPVSVEATDKRNRPRNKSNNKVGQSFDPYVMDETTETGGYVLIRPKRRQDGSDLSFSPYDLCLLLTSDSEMVLTDISRGIFRPPRDKDPDDPTAFRSCGIVGHSEVTRRELNGLILKVSKRQWAKIGQKEMLLVKIGSNVTALREFTALCRIDVLPLRKFLLGLHLASSHGAAHGHDEFRRKISTVRSTTAQLLELLGGKELLGQGFIDYCRNKFNMSQLTAIAASANEYGEGGFTLIKGPPGTGSTYV